MTFGGAAGPSAPPIRVMNSRGFIIRREAEATCSYRLNRRASIGAETGIKTIAAVHSQCRSWVISGQTIAVQNSLLSAVVRKRTLAGVVDNVR
jgi:hypothetical protein